MEWCTLQEIAIANAEPKLTPAFATWAERAIGPWRGGGESMMGPVCVMHELYHERGTL